MIYFHKLGDAASEGSARLRRPDHPDWTFGVKPTDDGKYLVADDFPQHRPAEPGASAATTSCRGRRRDQGLDRAHRRFRESVFVHRQRGHDVLLPDRSRCADEAHRDDGRRQAGPREPARDRAGATRRRSTAASIFSGQADRAQYAGRRAAARPGVRSRRASRSATSSCPASASAAGFGGEQDDKETFYSFTSYNTPTQIYRYDVLTRRKQAGPRSRR